jgi:transcriptional regulator with XRE-family HTH domain
MTTPNRLSPSAVGKRIRAARQSRNLSVAQAVELTGIDRSSFYELEAGDRWPRFRHLVLLHKGLRTEPGEIVSL